MLLSSIALILIMALPAGAARRIVSTARHRMHTIPTEWVNETPTAWFVELASPPAVEGTSKLQTSGRRSESLREGWPRRSASTITVRRSFSTLFNGVSIDIDRSQRGRLAQLPRVKAIYPVCRGPDAGYIGIRTRLGDGHPDDRSRHCAKRARLTGAGIKVAVMDTGVDYDHPDLGGGFGGGYRVAYGYDLVGDAYNADPDSPPTTRYRCPITIPMTVRVTGRTWPASSARMATSSVWPGGDLRRLPGLRL